MTPRADVLTRVDGRQPRAATFADALRAQGAPVVEVDWRPPAGGDAAMLSRAHALWGRHGTRSSRPRTRGGRGDRGCAPRAVTVAPAGAVDAGAARRAAAALRPADRVGPGLRPAAPGAAGRGAVRGLGGGRATRLPRCSIAAKIDARARQRARPRGPDDGRLLAVDAGLGRRGRLARAFSTLNEGPGGRCGSASATTSRSSGCGSSATSSARAWRGCSTTAARRRVRARRAGPEHGRRAAHAQPGDRQPARCASCWRRSPSLGGEDAARFIAGNHHFFLNLTMAAAKCASLAADACAGSSVVSLISRNGTDVGIQLAGMPGRWFIGAAAPVADALLREGYARRRRRARHRRLGGDRVRRARRHGARRRAGRRGVLRRRRRRRGRAHRADGGDLRGALRALHYHRPRLRRHPGRHRRPARRRARSHAPDHHGRPARARGHRPDRRRRRPPAGRAVPRRAHGARRVLMASASSPGAPALRAAARRGARRGRARASPTLARAPRPPRAARRPPRRSRPPRRAPRGHRALALGRAGAPLACSPARPARGRRRVRAAPGRLRALRRRVAAGRHPARPARPADTARRRPRAPRRSRPGERRARWTDALGAAASRSHVDARRPPPLRLRPPLRARLARRAGGGARGAPPAPPELATGSPRCAAAISPPPSHPRRPRRGPHAGRRRRARRLRRLAARARAARSPAALALAARLLAGHRARVPRAAPSAASCRSVAARVLRRSARATGSRARRRARATGGWGATLRRCHPVGRRAAAA